MEILNVGNTRVNTISRQQSPVELVINEEQPENGEYFIYLGSGFGGLEVACWSLVPKFAGSNPAETVGFFRAKKSSVRIPSEGK